MRSWVKELDGENLVYLYVCVKQHGKGTSPARNARTPSIPSITAIGGFFRIMPNRQKKYLRPYADEIIMEYRQLHIRPQHDFGHIQRIPITGTIP